MTNEELISDLIGEGYLKTPSLIEAFRKIDRLDFVPAEYQNQAYGNYPLPIGHGQTISQPLTVAFMLELLEPKPGEKILDIGSGSGWQTAILGQIVGFAGKVIAIERVSELAEMTRQNIAKYGLEIVQVFQADGSKGYEAEAPFDKIIAAAAAEEIPRSWKEQLKIGGRIVAPVENSVHLLEKTGPEEFTEKQHFGFSFVPLVTEIDRNL